MTFNHPIIVQPNTKWWKLDFPELWRYRELFMIFAWRDIKVRYKQTILGVTWALFQPLVTMVIFTIFFGRLAQIPSGKLPYSLFVLIGLVFWGFFSGGLAHATNSLIENENLIKKVYFPKIILPFTSVLVSFIDFTINLTLLLFYALFLGFFPPLQLLIFLPYVTVITALTSTGLGLFASALNVRYRDVRYILPFFIQICMFLTPVIYPLSIVSPSNRSLLALNPMTGAIETIRSILSRSDSTDWSIMVISTVMSLVLFFTGLAYFKSTEQHLVDAL